MYRLPDISYPINMKRHLQIASTTAKKSFSYSVNTKLEPSGFSPNTHIQEKKEASLNP